MLAVVIPAWNEAATIAENLHRALALPVGLVIPVLNGCTDMTAELVHRVRDRRVQPLRFAEPLGYDVPRVAGARLALEQGARAVLFVDGDLSGPIAGALTSLAGRLRKGADLVLTDCYLNTPVPVRATTARRVYAARLRLNRLLGRPDLGAAIPSHGPAGVSRRLLETVSPDSPAIPPLMQAEAVRAGLGVEVGAAIAHLDLGSARREPRHRALIAETIIGDCEEGCSLAEGRERSRNGHEGYHPGRRFDLIGLAAVSL